MSKKSKKAKRRAQRQQTLMTMVAAGSVGALVGMFMLGRRGVAGIFHAVDHALDNGSTAADLKGERRNGPGVRAPTDFRPDPIAPVNPRKRDSLAPATMPNPMAAEPVI